MAVPKTAAFCLKPDHIAMMPQMTFYSESLPLSRPFRISRGAKTCADVVVVEVAQDGMVGRGECVPYGRYEENCTSVMAQLAALQGQALDRAQVQGLLPRRGAQCAGLRAMGFGGEAFRYQRGGPSGYHPAPCPAHSIDRHA
jgi:hypothetical protein